MPKKVIVFDLDDGEDIVEALREVLQGEGLRYQKPRRKHSCRDERNYNSCAASTFGWSNGWGCGGSICGGNTCGSTLEYPRC